MFQITWVVLGINPVRFPYGGILFFVEIIVDFVVSISSESAHFELVMEAPFGFGRIEASDDMEFSLEKRIATGTIKLKEFQFISHSIQKLCYYRVASLFFIRIR